MITDALKKFLDQQVNDFNQPKFIEEDPISIPHRYIRKEDIEIAGFLAATISWGNRKAILNDADKMMKYFGKSPFDFVMTAQKKHLDRIEGCVHRTFHAEDLRFFILSLRNIYQHHGGMEFVFANYADKKNLQPAISRFREVFFSIMHPGRTLKHVSDPENGSSAKRINMMLRWFVRKDTKGVDFGIWKSLKPSQLSCPLDIHSGNIARKIGLLTRKQNDAKAVIELDQALRGLDPKDPVKYDFALFGLGVQKRESTISLVDFPLKQRV